MQPVEYVYRVYQELTLSDGTDWVWCLQTKSKELAFDKQDRLEKKGINCYIIEKILGGNHDWPQR